MPQIVVTIDGKTYRMACAEGEEQHLETLAADVDGKIAELRGSFGQIGDLRLTVMAAIMATDQLHEARRRLAEHARGGGRAGWRDRCFEPARPLRLRDRPADPLLPAG